MSSSNQFHKLIVDSDNFYVDFASPAFQVFLNNSNTHLKDSPITSTSRNSNGEKIVDGSENPDHKLSTNARIRLACQRFVESCSSKTTDQVSVSGLSEDEAKDIELLHTLLASVEKTGQGQFDCATKLVKLCSKTATTEGNPVERLVYYFSRALCEKINRETGRVVCDGLGRMQMFDLQEASTSVEASVFAFHQRVPMMQACQFTAIHTIIANVRQARKIHVIDLQIRDGKIYTVLLKALASRGEPRIEHVKITAIGTRAESRLQDTGNRLAEFAESNKIPFSFNIVMITDVLDFNLDLLEIDDDETVAIYSSCFLSSLIATPNHLEYLMRVIRRINPCVTVIAEIEANHTSPVFVNRFTEALFFYGALFDCMSYCLANDDRNRKVSESVLYGQSIRNIVAAEGDERTVRHIGVDVWRAFYARFGMLEIELSDVSLCEAKVLIGKFDCGNYCSLRADGGCLLVDWKDVPILSISAWKFL
ncbi:hypothetical protein OSB04_009602 [Centaurea solstitialis]|uniref:Uncharacterized protein n=1 Tax=Centaurea solstitialis TaxID=347529 RepID=A0AA38TDG4_9ASTR|nr:hypothetical protein OSB04_009602 [Centaurea solstitialis]